MEKMRRNLLFKTISLTVTITFLYQQLLWAIDYGLPVDNEKNLSGFMTADKLSEAQTRQEELIRRLDQYLAWKVASGYNDTEDWTLQRKTGATETSTTTQTQTATSTTEPPQTLDPSLLSLTTQTGDVLNYRGQALERVVLNDGTLLENLTLSDTGDILSGIIRYPDGSVFTVEEGRVTSSLSSDGTATHYDINGRIESEVAKDGIVSYYTYEFDEAGNVIKTTVTRPDSITEYGEDLKLQKVTKFDGTIIEYTNGIISKITKSDGSVYVFGRKQVTAPDGTDELVVSLRQYKDPNGNLYNYFDDTLTSIELNDGTRVTNIVIGQDGNLKDGTIQLRDGTVQTVVGGYLIKVTRPDGVIIDYERDSNNTLSKVILTLLDGTVFHYTSSGDLIKRINPDGTTYEYQNGLIQDKIYPDNTIATYIREYDLAAKPFKLTIEEPTNYASTYIFNELGSLTALGVDTNLPTLTPFDKPKSSMISVEGYMPSTGVTTTDGTYLYIKRLGATQGSDTFEKIGTGFNGTIAGKNYGTLASSSTSVSATYYSDGYIYNPMSG
ncbi:MAG: hypothetical protein HZA72_02525, partial [Candidatus Omnitrophica bacterium]|nr:hypothetical protein [Candidatus Omnitrophota bacterium]